MNNVNKSNKKNIIWWSVGLATGAVAAVAGGWAITKIVKEIRYDLMDTVFVSPDEDNTVTVKCGSSKFAKGMTFVKVVAESGENSCPMLLMVMGGKSGKISCEWIDNAHFVMYYIGKNKNKQVCEAVFEDGKITINHNVKKINIEQEV